mgnify:CR=1 FL=1
MAKMKINGCNLSNVADTHGTDPFLNEAIPAPSFDRQTCIVFILIRHQESKLPILMSFTVYFHFN